MFAHVKVADDLLHGTKTCTKGVKGPDPRHESAGHNPRRVTYHELGLTMFNVLTRLVVHAGAAWPALWYSLSTID